ncbi:type VI secretion system baseplate subunit TssG [Burkholderia gladioli]|uniref:type VI secretion system baseplate subunit TssG n=1 Tax=Burkholderia gladioli TaxID=28095 RepID=UPI0016401144|nr:type VI secretion system baseplate subunit TssG [Burkholderia gladioli]
MARNARQAPDPVALEAALRERPFDFEFFEAMRRLECAYPARPRLGHSTKPAEDPLRLAHAATLEFPARSIERFEPGTGGAPGRLHGLFLGLFGPQGPLPLHLTEHAVDRERNAKDPTLTAFADVFHHRMLSLFYRAWADAQPTVQYDRPESDRFRTYVGALIGIATPRLQDRDALPDQFKRFFAGRLVPQARNAEGLRGLLEHYFGVPVQVLEFVVGWMTLPEDAHLRMGGAMASMGRNATLGAQVRGAQQRFRLRIGPLGLAEFNRFLPGGEALRELTAAVKLYAGEEKGWDVQLVLKKEEVPASHLGQAGRMGFNTWMGRYAKPADADQVVLTPVA